MKRLLLPGGALLLLLLAAALLYFGIAHAMKPHLVPYPQVVVESGILPPTALPVSVLPKDPLLHVEGRFDFRGDDEAVAAWSASAVTLRFQGTAVQSELDLGQNRVQVTLDGRTVKVLTPMRPGRVLYDLATNLPDGEHTVTLLKCTEPVVGLMRFYGFRLNPGAMPLALPPRPHHIEVIGDSISAGFGNEAHNGAEQFSPLTENAYWSYGAMTARAFNADYACYAWSGRCLWPENTIPEIYDRILPHDPDSPVWDFSRQTPDVVLINLGTNDMFKEHPDETLWVQAYLAFIKRVRQHAPQATFYLANGPMLSDRWPQGHDNLSTLRRYVKNAVQQAHDQGLPNVHYLEFPEQFHNGLGVGAAGHPSFLTQQLMARQWIAALRHDLGWTQVEEPVR